MVELISLNKERIGFVFLLIEKIDSSCPNNVCGTGKCFSINDPLLPYVCLCPNAKFAMSCQGMGNDRFFFVLDLGFIGAVRYPITTARMLITTTRALDVCNPLNSESCMNGGQCLPMMNDYQCLCTSGFTGRFCEESKFCDDLYVFENI
jgi:hypothetical protein